MTDEIQQEIPSTFADPLAAFLAEAIAKLDVMLGGPCDVRETPGDADTPRVTEKQQRKKPVREEALAAHDAFEPRAAA